MKCDVGKSFLRDPEERGPRGRIKPFDRGEGRQPGGKVGSFPKGLEAGLERRNQTEIIEDDRAQIGSDTIDDFDGLPDEPLSDFNRFLELHRVLGNPRSQNREMHVDADEGPGNEIMQFPADPPPFILLDGEESSIEGAGLLLQSV
jgi:hypothetical protein